MYVWEYVREGAEYVIGLCVRLRMVFPPVCARVCMYVCMRVRACVCASV
jgi:hypothetical protein